jgi:hypothetical protein
MDSIVARKMLARRATTYTGINARRRMPSIFMPWKLIALLLMGTAQSSAQTAKASSNPRRPVLVELFTSEGCSSCPPADDLLARLDESQPIDGATMIPLEEHVDYWDHQGWRDPFSSSLFTLRQQQYGETLHVENIYTPQMVIDGRTELTGNDAARATAAIRAALSTPKLGVALTPEELSGSKVRLTIRADAPDVPAQVFLAIVELHLASDVERGENAGRRLKHSAVVRRMNSIRKVKAGEEFSSSPVISLEKSWKPENVRAIVFVQKLDGRQVLGAAEVMFRR